MTRYASISTGDTMAVVEVREDVYVPLESVREIDATTTSDTIATAGRLVSAGLRPDEVTLLPVVPRPGRIFCVGLNYRSHVGESGRDLPTYPVLFPKYASSLISADDDIVLPPESSQVDFEGELAVVIGRRGRRISQRDAERYVLGYSIANDVTMRDFQYRSHQWMQGKAWDRSTPLGPYLVTREEFDPDHARITTTLNGEVMQDSDLSQLIFPVARLIQSISEFTELTPGDVILSGTPAGVGYRRDPQVFLQDGDEVRVAIEGIGELVSRVRRE